MSEMEALVEARGLTRRFGPLTAVDELNLEVSPGEIFGLVGPDGAGKTTTLRLLTGLINPTSGEARIGGHDVSRETRAVRDQIGYMAQRFGLYPDLTVKENIGFYADLFGVGKKELDAVVPRLLHMTRMEPFVARYAGRLSGGMKQKLALICTLLHRPRLLLLDEPTNGVDPVSRRDFWAILYELVKGGITVFVTTAYLDEAERCNRVGLMHRGRLICCDTPEALRRPFLGVCYEVQPSDQRAARLCLQGVPGVTAVETSGPSLHLFLAPSATSPEALQQTLERSGFGPAAFRSISPSLEDVFIAQVRAAEAR
jgi:ABC-2 type transport system ATP-binding protein